MVRGMANASERVAVAAVVPVWVAAPVWPAAPVSAAVLVLAAVLVPALVLAPALVQAVLARPLALTPFLLASGLKTRRLDALRSGPALATIAYESAGAELLFGPAPASPQSR